MRSAARTQADLARVTLTLTSGSASPRAERLDGWEARLAEVFKAASAEPYVLGQHDCFSVACAAIKALTGADHWPAWQGTYSTQREALRRIVEFDERGFTAAFSRLFGVLPMAMENARRGDIAAFVDPRGMPHLGIVTGVSVAVLGEQGMLHVNRSACAHVWMIG